MDTVRLFEDFVKQVNNMNDDDIKKSINDAISNSSDEDKSMDEKHKIWKYEKFKGDSAIYAFCPKCNFHYNPSRWNNKTGIELAFQYKYCPNCGEYLFDDSENVNVIWNDRDIKELYDL